MPSRTLAMIRRDINRLDETCKEYGPKHAALDALRPLVEKQAAAVNSAYQAYIDALAKGSKERTERETSLDSLRSSVSRWRPVVLLTVDGSEATLHAMPPRGGTADDMIHIAEDLQQFIKTHPGTAAFRKDALAELDPEIAAARQQVHEATVALPEEHAARDAFTAAALAANSFVVHGSEVVRATFGPSSQQYRQFIEHDRNDVAAIDAEAAAGEQAAGVATALAASAATASATAATTKAAAATTS